MNKEYKENGTKNWALRNARCYRNPPADCTLENNPLLSVKQKFWIHWRREPRIPREWSLDRSKLWPTLPNAELKSKKIPSTTLHFPSSRDLQTRWKNFKSIYSQFLPLRKPNWLSDMISCSSAYFKIRTEINFSKTLYKILVRETGR